MCNCIHRWWDEKYSGRKRSLELGHGFPVVPPFFVHVLGVESTAPMEKVNIKYTILFYMHCRSGK